MFNRKSSTVLTRAVSAVLSGVVLSGAATVAMAAEGGLEEVVVTARRVNESLQDTPVAITAITSETISSFRLQGMSEFASLAPNAYVPKDAYNQNTRISIRGGRNVDPQVEPDFGLYRNGQYYGGPRTNLSSLVDVERVEVLRGPQVALYGRNAMNGAVNIVFAEPKAEDSAYVSAEYGSYNRTDLQGWVNGGTDKFAVRAAGWWIKQDSGEHYNPVLKQDLDKFSDGGARLSAKWRPTENLDVLWVVENGRFDGPDTTEFVESARCCGLFGPFAGGPLPAETKDTILRNTPSEANADTTYISQELNWRTTAGTMTLLANYRDYGRDAMRDFDETPFEPEDFVFAYKQVNKNHDAAEDVNVDLRWTSPREQRLTWMAGVSYLKENLSLNRSFATSLDLDYLGFLGIPPLGVATATGKNDIGIDTKSWSAYGEVTFAVTDQLDVIVGGRYTDDQKDLNFAQYIETDGTPGSSILAYLFCNPGGCTFPSYSLVDSNSFTNFSPMGEVTYKFSDDMNMYALISTGFRAGSYNTTSTNPAYLPYDSETGINYELGFKSMLLDDRVRFNAAAFMFDVDDVLLRVLDPNNPTQFSYLQNAGKSRTYGVEAELAWRPTDGLDLAATVGWLDSEITEGYTSDQNIATEPGPGVVCDEDGVCKTDISGSPIPGARDWTVALLANYVHPITDSLSWTANASYRYQTGGYWNAIPKYPSEGYQREPMDDYKFADLSTGFEGDKWRVVLFANNIGDETPVVIRRTVQVDRAQGVTYGVRFSARY
ncbi:MAG TPA: TonB-dependent receptor [Steroidobacteraceae bacterium]